MSHAEASEPWPNSETCLTEYAATLLSQQTWCWGQDILRPEGNWLVQLGFQRIEPPPEYQDGSSVYFCNLPRERNIVLRGFGIFFGNRQIGGVYLSRFGFDHDSVETRSPPLVRRELAQNAIAHSTTTERMPLVDP